MDIRMGLTRCAAIAALAIGFGSGCGGDDSSSDGTGSTFTYASDVLDGRYIGQVTAGGETAGLVMQVDQNSYLVYGPIEIGDMSGRFSGSFTGNAISFQANVTNVSQTGTFRFSGTIEDGGDTFEGTVDGVVNGTAGSGTWSARR